ncbi:MAG: UDP-N-acetylenolpyruvoylglucosamine reductase [Candidatus Rokuibacteriota bacterium]|nr:MAG: UDP-N-acetylenolpyruvoylglucosamine reductase [Candidatus Rokubacteria bacterium]
MAPLEHVRLAPHCTMGVGGPARFFVEVQDEAAVLAALEWARGRGVPLYVLGGGSNLVVGDEGIEALVVKIALRGIDTHEADGAVELTAAAGEPWDVLVARTVERGWAGLESLSGIPGLVGATPMQNVGAYGQEVSETVTVVRALDTSTGSIVSFKNRECRFTYRDSLFRSGEPGRYVVLSVSYRLRPNGRAAVRYADVEKDLAARGVATPSLADVRASVIAIRRSKSMVLDSQDENRRSCGSFFTNPIIPSAELAAVKSRAGDPSMPRWPLPGGQVKLSAAWLIERAGYARGHADGPVGLSTRHALAIVAHDGARACDVVAFARRVQAAVAERFGVRLTPEPVFWGVTAR